MSKKISKSKKDSLVKASVGADIIGQSIENKEVVMKTEDGSESQAIQHICDNFYKVSINSIIVESADIDESDVLKFYNPRKIDCTEESKGEGFSPEKMAELRDSIRTRGLLTPLICRFKNYDGKAPVSLVNGHRRFAVLQELVASNTPCYDPKTKETVGAAELYNTIPCQVYALANDLECYIMSFEEDKTKVKFGPGTEARFVQYCRSRFIDDDKIVQMTGNSPEWLQETYSIIDSLIDDSVVLSAFFSGKIDRGLSKYLSNIENIENRHALMNGAINNASERYKQKMEKIDCSIEAKLEKIDNLEASIVVSEHSGNQKDIDEKQAKIEELEGEIKAVKKKKSASMPRAGRADLKKAVRKAANIYNHTEDEMPASNRISTKWPEFFKGVIDNGGAVPDQEEIIVPDVLARYSVALLKIVENGQANPVEFLTGWIKKFSNSGLQND